MIGDLLTAVKTWMAGTGKPVFLEEIHGTAVLPALVINTYGIGAPETWTLADVACRWVGIEFSSVGRSTKDALWLDARVTALLHQDPPTDLGVHIAAVDLEPATALEPGTGRMLAVHRCAIAYR